MHLRQKSHQSITDRVYRWNESFPFKAFTPYQPPDINLQIAGVLQQVIHNICRLMPILIYSMKNRSLTSKSIFIQASSCIHISPVSNQNFRTIDMIEFGAYM